MVDRIRSDEKETIGKYYIYIEIIVLLTVFTMIDALILKTEYVIFVSNSFKTLSIVFMLTFSIFSITYYVVLIKKIKRSLVNKTRKNKTKNLKSVYNEFWEFISEDNDTFREFIIKDLKRRQIIKLIAA